MVQQLGTSHEKLERTGASKIQHQTANGTKKKPPLLWATTDIDTSLMVLDSMLLILIQNKAFF